MLLYMVMVMIFASFFCIFRLIFGLCFKNKSIVSIRLEKIAQQDAAKNEIEELNQPLFVRMIRPVLDSVSRTIIRITPREVISGFEKKIIMAGNPYKLSVKDWVNIQVIIVVCLPLITTAIGYYRDMDARNILFLSMIEIGLGLVLPNLLISKKIVDRQKKIVNSLPDIIDLLTVSVEAGLGFDGALAKVIDKMPGPLASEFENVLQEIKVGKQKRDALRDMADRICVADLTTFVSSIIQADQFGVSIGNVLRIQSAQVRQKRRQRAQEKAMKAPVKMLIPMVLFIFPTIFSVLMGPVVIRMMEVFMK